MVTTPVTGQGLVHPAEPASVRRSDERLGERCTGRNSTYGISTAVSQKQFTDYHLNNTSFHQIIFSIITNCYQQWLWATLWVLI